MFSFLTLYNDARKLKEKLISLRTDQKVGEYIDSKGGEISKTNHSTEKDVKQAEYEYNFLCLTLLIWLIVWIIALVLFIKYFKYMKEWEILVVLAALLLGWGFLPLIYILMVVKTRTEKLFSYSSNVSKLEESFYKTENRSNLNKEFY